MPRRFVKTFCPPPRRFLHGAQIRCMILFWSPICLQTALAARLKSSSRRESALTLPRFSKEM
jgi:hypothetical protein